MKVKKALSVTVIAAVASATAVLGAAPAHASVSKTKCYGGIWDPTETCISLEYSYFLDGRAVSIDQLYLGANLPTGETQQGHWQWWTGDGIVWGNTEPGAPGSGYHNTPTYNVTGRGAPPKAQFPYKHNQVFNLSRNMHLCAIYWEHRGGTNYKNQGTLCYSFYNGSWNR